MIKLHMPALVINEFEMAVDTCVMSIIGSCDTHYDYPTVGAMLLRRIGKFRRPFNAPAPSIVRDTCGDASTSDQNTIAKLLDTVHGKLNADVATRIAVHSDANGYDAALNDLLPQPVLPFQVFTVDGVPVEERLRRATDGSAAYDILASEDLVVTREAQFIKLGFKSRMDYRQCALLLPRSGFGVKWGFALVNTVGLIDSDYPDEWMAKIYLHEVEGIPLPEDGGLKIPKGERLAQFVLTSVEHPVLQQVKDEADLRPTGRVGGFGSSNIHK